MEIVQDKWKEILQRVRDEHELSEISFTTWIEPLTIHSVEDNLITILVPSEKMGLDYVSKKYTLPIKVAIAEITGVNYDAFDRTFYSSKEPVFADSLRNE